MNIVRGKYATKRVYRPEVDEIRRQETEGSEPGSLLVWDPKVLNQYEGKCHWLKSERSALSEICHAPLVISVMPYLLTLFNQ
jgi:hypothetical protein